jgi:putative nucleotidyltransferase with HDIG domain
VESRDIYTAGHNFRVALYALRIAEEMSVSPELCRALVTGAIVHDVGKIHIPNDILNKPGKLTEEERKIIESHPVRGYQLCKNLGFMQEELGIIRSHHERMDGQGYPDRLSGEQIPFLARIVAVADVYDALTSERAYRQAWTHEEAMYYLRIHKGTHFDPAVVDAWQQACDRDSRVYEEVRARVHLFHTQGAQDMF